MEIGIYDDNEQFIEKVENQCKCSLNNKMYIFTNDNANEIHEKVLDVLLIGMNYVRKNKMEYMKIIEHIDPDTYIIFLHDTDEERDKIAQKSRVISLNYKKERNKLKCILTDISCYRKVKNYIELDDGRVIMAKNVAFINAADIYSRIHIINGEEITIRKALSHMEYELRNYKFYRIHRSYLVNMNYVREIDRDSIVLKDNKRIPISRRKYMNVKKAFVEYWNHIILDNNR